MRSDIRVPFGTAGLGAWWSPSSCSACRAPASRVARPTRPRARRTGRPAQYEPAGRQAGRRGVGADGAARPSAARLAAGPGGRLYGPWTTAAVTRFQSAAARGRRCRRSGHAECAHARAGRAAPAGSRLCTARRIAAGSCPPDEVDGARASARPGGRPLRPADAGCGDAASAVRWSPGQRRGQRPDAAAPDRGSRPDRATRLDEAGGRAGQDRRAAVRRRQQRRQDGERPAAHRVDSSTPVRFSATGRTTLPCRSRS